jgi:hypothetical protein
VLAMAMEGHPSNLILGMKQQWNWRADWQTEAMGMWDLCQVPAVSPETCPFQHYKAEICNPVWYPLGIVTGYGVDDWGVGSLCPGRVKNFLFSTSSRPALGPTKPPIKWVLGVLSPGVKQQGCEVYHSPPTSAKVKKIWIYTSTPPYAFML